MWRQFSHRLFALSNSAAASDEVEAPGGISIEWPCFFAKLNAREKLCGAILEASCRESWHRLRLWPMHILDDAGCASLLSKCLGGSVLKFGRFFYVMAYITFRNSRCNSYSIVERHRKDFFVEFILDDSFIEYS